jgi:hypothetical protein
MFLHVVVINGTSIPDWIAAVSTALLVLGAALAFLGIQWQVRNERVNHEERLTQAQKNHEESLAATFRPIVVVTQSEEFWGTDGNTSGFMLRVCARNIGPGPATDVELKGWAFVPKSRGTDVGSRRDEIDAASASVDFDDPDFFVRLGTLAAGEHRHARPLPWKEKPWPTPLADQLAVLLYSASYKDLRAIEFPREDIVLKAGNVQIHPETTCRIDSSNH